MWQVLLLAGVAGARVTSGQTTAQTTRAAIAAAEGRGAQTARDLAAIRAGLRRGDIESARAAIRALGRLERPVLIPELMVTLRSMLPEVRAESATAIGQAAQGIGRDDTRAPGSPSLGSVLSTLSSRLGVEADPTVRAALCESIGRLPYATSEDAARGESALVDFGLQQTDVLDRLGIAKGFEAFVRRPSAQPLGQRAVRMLRLLAVGELDSGGPGLSAAAIDPLRDARVRRLALEALGTIGSLDGDLLDRAVLDLDAQVRRLAVSLAAKTAAMDPARADRVIARGMEDPSVMVRVEAVRAAVAREGTGRHHCATLGSATGDESTMVVMAAIDGLVACEGDDTTVGLIERLATAAPTIGDPRSGQVATAALIALARLAPERGTALIEEYTGSPLPSRRNAAERATRVLAASANRSTSIDSDQDPVSAVTAEDLRRIGQPRARIAVQDLGYFDVQLFTLEAPRTVAEFVRRAEAGAFDGQLLGRVVANGTAEGPVLPVVPVEGAGGRTARNTAEVSAWPHVRGAVALAVAEGELSAGRIFIDLVDNPRFDHVHPVFGQALNGLDVLDRLVEGDVIEHVTILP